MPQARRHDDRQQPEAIELDGRTLEGGGQLLRIAVCLSALTGVPIRITDIRGNRTGGGGLKAQHLACVTWLAHACGARVEGAEKGSRTLLFEPGRAVPDSGSHVFREQTGHAGEPVYDAPDVRIGSAGSTGLALQAVLPFLLFSPQVPRDRPVRIMLSGGTNVSGSPSYEYISDVLLPTLRRIGFGEMRPVIAKRGWSHGGTSIGELTLEIPPRTDRAAILSAFTLRPPGDDSEILPPPKPSNLQAKFIAPAACHESLESLLLPAIRGEFGASYTPGVDLHITCEDSRHDKRMYFILIATVPTGAADAATPPYVLGRDWLYDRKIRSHAAATKQLVEQVIRDLAQEWRSGAHVDEHMRDQLVIFQALAAGVSEVHPGWAHDAADGEASLKEPSLHARTAEWVAKQMLGVRFGVDCTCEGVAFRNTGADLATPSSDLNDDRVDRDMSDLLAKVLR